MKLLQFLLFVLAVLGVAYMRDVFGVIAGIPTMYGLILTIVCVILFVLILRRSDTDTGQSSKGVRRFGRDT